MNSNSQAPSGGDTRQALDSRGTRQAVDPAAVFSRVVCASHAPGQREEAPQRKGEHRRVMQYAPCLLACPLGPLPACLRAASAAQPAQHGRVFGVHGELLKRRCVECCAAGVVARPRRLPSVGLWRADAAHLVDCRRGVDLLPRRAQGHRLHAWVSASRSSPEAMRCPLHATEFFAEAIRHRYPTGRSNYKYKTTLKGKTTREP